MKINNIQGNSNLRKIDFPQDQAQTRTEKEDLKEENPAAVYEKSQSRESSHIYNKNAILKLKRQSELANAQLIRLVEKMLQRQGKTWQALKTGELIEVDETARLEAQELIGPDGDLGAEAVSQRLVDFAIALSGGDKSKAESLRTAIEKGFQEAERILGELPEVSKETYRLTMEKFDAWVNGEE